MRLTSLTQVPLVLKRSIVWVVVGVGVSVVVRVKVFVSLTIAVTVPQITNPNRVSPGPNLRLTPGTGGTRLDAATTAATAAIAATATSLTFAFAITSAIDVAVPISREGGVQGGRRKRNGSGRYYHGGLYNERRNRRCNGGLYNERR